MDLAIQYETVEVYAQVVPSSEEMLEAMSIPHPLSGTHGSCGDRVSHVRLGQLLTAISLLKIS